MKKTLMAIAAALAAATTFADTLQGTQGTSFEGMAGTGKTVFGRGSGADFGPGYGDTGVAGTTYWYMKTDAIVGGLKQFEGGMAYTGECGLPAAAASDGITAPANEGYYINLDAPERIERLAQEFDGTGDPAGVDLDGVYFDSMVQFTATYERPELNTDSSSGTLDKIAIWLYAPDDTDQLLGTDTNLVITAGYLQGTTSVATDYVIPTSQLEIEPGKWYRLTVKAIGDITTTSNQFAGFVVFIDGTPVYTSAAKWAANGEFPTEVAENLTAVASKWNTQGALFPSIDVSSTAKNTFTAAGFIGTGAIDDVTITSVAPAFASDGEKVFVTWTAGIGTLQIGGQPVDGFVAGQAGSIELDYDAAASYTVFATPLSDDYNIGAWTLGGTEVTPVAGNNGYSYAFEPGANGEISIGFTLPVAKVGNDRFNDLQQAFDAAVTASASGTPATVKLLDNVTFADQEDGVLIESGKIIFDLNGKTIAAAEGATLSSALINAFNANLQIITSVAGGTLSYPDGEDDLGAINIGNGAALKIGAAEGDMGVTINGPVYFTAATVAVYRGTFSNGNDETFLENGALKEQFIPEDLAKAPEVTTGADFFTIAPSSAVDTEYTSPDGTSKFTIPADAVTLPEGKTLADTAATIDGTAISYATAYALGLTIAADGTVSGELKVSIEIVNGQVVLTPTIGREGYTISVTYLKSADLKTWAAAEEADFTAGEKKFYKINIETIGITNAGE